MIQNPGIIQIADDISKQYTIQYLQERNVKEKIFTENE